MYGCLGSIHTALSRKSRCDCESGRVGFEFEDSCCAEESVDDGGGPPVGRDSATLAVWMGEMCFVFRCGVAMLGARNSRIGEDEGTIDDWRARRLDRSADGMFSDC